LLETAFGIEMVYFVNNFRDRCDGVYMKHRVVIYGIIEWACHIQGYQYRVGHVTILGPQQRGDSEDRQR
jgi:hypothetical protein